MRTSTGITRSASKSPLALSVLSNTERALDLQHKPVQVLRRTPNGAVFSRSQQLCFEIRILWLTFVKVLQRDGVSH